MAYRVEVSKALAQAYSKELRREVQYDYDVQAWIADGRYQSCAHPASMRCQCYGRLHEGEKAPSIH